MREFRDEYWDDCEEQVECPWTTGLCNREEMDCHNCEIEQDALEFYSKLEKEGKLYGTQEDKPTRRPRETRQ